MTSDVSEYVRRKTAGEAAEREAGDLANRSRLERVSSPDVHFDLSWDDVTIEQPIGFGGFSQVFRVKLHGNPDRDFALKCLNPQTKLKTKSFKTGAVDLAIEGEILSRLDHENVIKLHGIIGLGPLESYMESDRGYFIVLDLLSDTLASKLEKYRDFYKGSSSGGGGMSRSSASSTTKHMSSSAVLERVSSVAIGVAKGMEYLHSQGVALRDLKVTRYIGHIVVLIGSLASAHLRYVRPCFPLIVSRTTLDLMNTGQLNFSIWDLPEKNIPSNRLKSLDHSDTWHQKSRRAWEVS